MKKRMLQVNWAGKACKKGLGDCGKELRCYSKCSEKPLGSFK